MNTHVQDNAERQAAALTHYHAHYNNDSYRAVQVALIADLYGEPFAHDTSIREQLLGEETPYFLMNLLGDVALEICGFPGMTGKQQVLVNENALRQLSPETVRLMSQHLEHFEDNGSTFSADFENTALTLLQVMAIRKSVQATESLSSVIHTGQGRASHHLLKSASALLHAAELLLKAESSKSYLGEKLSQGTSALADALNEFQKIYP
jgi:hypothetical protein